MSFWDKVGSIDVKVKLIVGLFIASGTVYNLVLPYFRELPSQRLNRYDEAFKVYNRIIEAETDIDQEVLRTMGLELYHCNKDQYNTPKFSFIKVDGRLREAEFSRTKQTWTYKDDTGHWTPIQNLVK
jgi:hypothetical protein